MKIKNMTQAQYGKARGVSQQYVSKLISKGIIKLEPDGRINPKKADKAIADNLDPSLSGKLKTKLGISDTTFSKTRLQKETLNVLLLKLEYEEKIGLLVSAEKVKRDAFAKGRTIRDALLLLPDRLGFLNHDQKELMRKEINQTLEVLSK